MDKSNNKTFGTQPNASMRVGSSEIVEEEKSADGGVSSKNTASRFTTFEVLPTNQNGVKSPAAGATKTPLNMTVPITPVDQTSPTGRGKLAFS